MPQIHRREGSQPEEVLRVLRDVGRDVELALDDVVFDLLLAAVGAEGGAAREQVEEEDAQRPPVRRLPVPGVLYHDLKRAALVEWRRIIWSSIAYVGLTGIWHKITMNAAVRQTSTL